MIKINWQITDTLEKVSLNEFETEWNGIYGFFSLMINDEVLGFCPEVKERSVEGNENILYWLSELRKATQTVSQGKEYRMPLLSMNLCDVLFEGSKEVTIRLIDIRTNEIIWEEIIAFGELRAEVEKNVDKLISYVRKINSELTLKL